MNRYQQHHPQTHHLNTILPSNHHHFHLNNNSNSGSSSTTTTTTTTATVLQTPHDTYSSSNNSIVDLHSPNHYNLLDDTYVYNTSPSYCPKHHQIYRSPTLCTLDNQASIYENYSSSTIIPIHTPPNTYEQFCIDPTQTSPSSWLTPATTGTSSTTATTAASTATHEAIYHPIQSFDQCNIYLTHSNSSDSTYRDFPSIPLSNNESSSSSSSSSSPLSSSPSFNPHSNSIHTQQYRQQHHILEQSSIDEKPSGHAGNEAKYKWMQIKRTPAKTAGMSYDDIY
jgi:hypothetical protein